jgi:hypothetical protein
VLISRERREVLLDEYEKSGLSGARFARLAGIAYSTFASWRQSRRKKDAGNPGEAVAASIDAVERRPAQAPIRFLEASVESGQQTGVNQAGMPAGLTVELPGGARMQIGSPIQLRLAAELIALTSQTLKRPC